MQWRCQYAMPHHDPTTRLTVNTSTFDAALPLLDAMQSGGECKYRAGVQRQRPQALPTVHSIPAQ
jgi:hypothetical protein